MKHLVFLVCFVFILCGLVEGQTTSEPRLGKFSIDVRGTKLRLGMTKDEVTGKLAGNQITKFKDDEWMVGSGKDLGPTLQFTHNRLSYADRYWTTYDNDIAEALFGAVSTLNQEGITSCTITTSIRPDPTTTVHQVWVHCGEKSILIVRSTIDGKSYNSVYEQLGILQSRE